jgi:hypothetical protein
MTGVELVGVREVAKQRNALKGVQGNEIPGIRSRRNLVMNLNPIDMSQMMGMTIYLIVL